MAPEPENFDLTEDAALGGRLRLKQPRRGHRFGHDAVLLAAACLAEPGDHVVELGAGVGLAGLAVAWRVPDTTVTLVEIDPRLAALATENAARNGLAERVRAVALDVAAPPRAFAAAGLGEGTAARVLMNPPFNDGAQARPSPDGARALAHMAARAMLPRWCRAAARLLAHGGTLTLIWRADGLPDVLDALRGFGGIAIGPVHPHPNAKAIRIIVNAKKGSRAPPFILPSFILNGADGRPTREAEAVLRDGAEL